MNEKKKKNAKEKFKSKRVWLHAERGESCEKIEIGGIFFSISSVASKFFLKKCFEFRHVDLDSSEDYLSILPTQWPFNGVKMLQIYGKNLKTWTC